jgi:hypothetical protein
MKPLNAALAVLSTCLALSAQAVGRLAELSILDRASGQELPVHWHKGRAYVVGRPGNEYQVIVRNRAGEDLLAVVSVDGLNVMNGQPANARQSGYIVSPWSRVDVRGWRKSMDEIAAFYFTTLSDSYAGRTGKPDNVGVIGVALFQRKRIEPPPPEAAVAPGTSQYAPLDRERADARRESANEARAPKLAEAAPSVIRPAPAAPLGTGHGRREESRVQWQEFERSTDAPVERIAIYYDSYRNLVAQGVLQPSYGRRDPDPFPAAFTPDP